MGSSDLTYFVTGERYCIGGRQYDLSVYRQAQSFYASCWCTDCGIREETPRYDGDLQAREAGERLLEAHHAAVHAA
jgi:hypothetical protein